MSKLNFSIALKMTTAQFKKGADVVKKSLKDIQYQVLGMVSALGVGALGLKGLVSQFVDVARETNRARVALKNISGDAQGYANNMNFLIRTSRKWGQELNGMTAEFSKFSAAATSAGIPIQQQQEIFESFTRSITAFGMSGEEAKLSYLALSQMMSKGKVSSEELRRQLGEKMPVAMEAMARAAGVTIQKLDGLLSQGKLISKEIMLPFVKEMEKMLPQVDVDNIETSVNRLKNTFTKLTEDLRIGGFYKKLVDGANTALAGVQQSFARIALVIVNSIAGAKITSALMKLRVKTAETNAAMVAEKQRTELQKQVATEKRIAAEKRLNEMNAIWERNTDEQTFQNKLKLHSYETALNKAKLNEKAAYAAAERAAAVKTTTLWQTAWNNVKASAVAAFATIRTLLATAIPMALIGWVTNFVMRIRELRKEAKEIKNILSDFRKEASSVNAGQEYKMLESALAILRNQKSTQEEINNARKSLQSILQSEKTTEQELLKLAEKRMQLLKATAGAEFYTNKSISTQDEIDSIYAKYGGEKGMESKMRLRGTGQQIKKSAYELFGAKLQIDLDYEKIQELYKVLNESDAKIQEYIKGGIITEPLSSTYTPEDSDKKKKKTDLQKAEEKYTETMLKYNNQLNEGLLRQSEYNTLIDNLNEDTAKTISGLLGTKASGNTTFLKALEGLNNPKSLETLEKRLNEIGSEMDKVFGVGNVDLKNRKNIDTELLRRAGWGDVGGDYATLFSQSIGMQQDGKEVMVHITPILPDGSVLSPEELDDYIDNVLNGTKNILTKDASANKGMGVVLGVSSNTAVEAASEWGESLHLLQEEYYGLKNSIDEARGAFEEIESIFTKAEKGTRDTTFDYKKSESDKIREEIALQEEYAKKVEEYYDDLKNYSKQALDEIKSEQDKVTSLSEALKLAQLKEDLDKINLDLFSTSMSAVTGFADGLDRAARAWNRLANEDLSGFQRMVAIINALGDTLKGLIATWEMYNAVKELISQREQVRQSLDNINTAQSIANSAAEVAASTATVAAKGPEVAANTADAATKAASSVAGVPLIGPILAVAAAGSVLAALAAIPKFAHGGIVGGASRSGDKNLIRANSGEMVITTAQQSGLWNAIKKGDYGSGKNAGGEFIIRGRDLVKIIDQENKVRSRI